MSKTIQLGDYISTLKGFAFKSQWYEKDGHPIVKVSDFTENSIDTSKLVKIPFEVAEKYKKYALKTNDIVIQTVGSWPSNPASVVGKTIKVPCKAHGSLLNQNAVIIYPDENIDQSYLYYVLKDQNFKDYIVGTAQGAASQASITLDAIKGFELELPDQEVQQKIASILSAYDDLIENNNRRIAILEEMARSLYREWFVKFLFPGHEEVKMVDSELGQIPEGWEVSPLENLCSRITDGSHKSPKSVLEGFPMASVKDMHDFGLNVNSCRKISKEDFDDLVRNDCKVTANDVLIAKDGSYLKHTFVVEKDLDIALLSSIAMLRPNNKIKSHFLSFCLKSPEIKERMKQCVSGVAIPRIILQDFRNFKIVVPAIDLQEQWNNLIKDNMQMCWNLIKKNDLLKTQRDMLLPKLISGKIEV